MCISFKECCDVQNREGLVLFTNKFSHFLRCKSLLDLLLYAAAGV